MGWILTIIAGGIAGFVAEKLMNFNTGLLMNIVLGIVGAVVMNIILNALGAPLLGAGFLGYIVKGIAGACLLIYGYRLIKSR
ncbi:MAG: GlsB/YeaQ/YmgE family stress response membrane protein [Rhizobiales bacterium]|nr:GlsB/YeaQ/YmgE family stress response membrane protein [Hyphomicrobiales bacterium]